jgi:hypothetical protein
MAKSEKKISRKLLTCTKQFSVPKYNKPPPTTQTFLQTSLLTVLLTECSSGNKIEKNEMGRACSTYWIVERCIEVWVGKPEGKRPLGSPNILVDGRIILR